MATREIGIFALPTVLVPGERIPLHIFEERYKQLIGECVESGGEFLLLYSDEDGTREIGCAARVESVLDQLDDGRMNILVEGTAVLQVVELTRTGRPYTTVMADTAGDDPALGAEETDSVLTLFRQIAAAGGGDPEEDLTAAGWPLSYTIMARVDFPAAEKQRVLELRTETGAPADRAGAAPRPDERQGAARRLIAARWCATPWRRWRRQTASMPAPSPPARWRSGTWAR
jgi:Lon protease-like protein